MFSFFKKSSLVSDISWLGIDLHSHILPGIDDGAKHIDDSLSYIYKLESLGFDKLFFTPHILKDLYPNSRDTILPALQSVQEKLDELVNPFPISAAAEYMIDDNFEIDDQLLCLPGNHILIEMSYLAESPNIEEVIFNLQIKGYKVILAHPERYNFYHKDLHRYTKLKELGCLFQLNLLAVSGYYGKNVMLIAKYLLEHHMYDLAATDLHHDKHMDILTKMVLSGKLHEKLGHYDFKNKQLFG